MTTLLLALVTAVPEQEAFRPASDPAVTVKNTLPVVFATVPPAVQDEPEVRDETRAAAADIEVDVAAALKVEALRVGATVAGRAAEALADAVADASAGVDPVADPVVDPAAAKCRSPAPGASSGSAASMRATVQNFFTVRCSVAVSAASRTAGLGPAADRVVVPVAVAAAPCAAGSITPAAARAGTARTARRRALGCMPGYLRVGMS
ncbi:hypothetical protein [Microbispora rosea]|uniref:hypothetical protein n=1 Tax=Microbispora rosea TaxID=58117 RepID=UPI001A5C2A1D|nr:hypothetical protein [Microbispora rosea]GIH52539.1 hypothetical protein Mro03_77180 [Microbispora rosea subsp. rosea]